MMTSSRLILLLTAISVLSGCGGGGGSDTASSGSVATTPPATPTTPTTPTPPTTPTTPTPPTVPTAPVTPLPDSVAAILAQKMGKPKQFLIGLGSGMSTTDIKAQSITPDIYDQYLVGVGNTAWPSWNLPSGAYVGITATNAKNIGAVPMFTLYQMAQNGDGNLSGLTDANFMTKYWAQTKLLFTELKKFDGPALVNLEPDFWGYVQSQAPGGDPTKLSAQVTIMPECSALTNDAVGIAGCMLTLARLYAPKALVGFPVSIFGRKEADVAQFMTKIGAAKADFIVEQTIDRDAGCYEVLPSPSECNHSTAALYWDESNLTSPNFHDYLSGVSIIQQGIGGLPVLWWQMPMGVPSATPGGTPGHYRDNRVHYILTHPAEFTKVGGVGVVFSAGATNQTTILTDGGQFQNLWKAYIKTPAAL
ncbi:hypothetical protein AAKU64_000777 [Undibacterium sp. GrIS 1.8]|uniref:hypothetical protein n=1 Tax=unclassified Undibacterium TaxID=2630295 RepID=UPI003392195F